MDTTLKIWIAVINQRQARLMRGSITPPGRYHLDLVATVENSELEHEHSRPSPRRGHAGHSNASGSHRDEQLRSFASHIAEWITSACDEHSIQELSVLAPPRLADLLRPNFPTALASRVREIPLDLGTLELGGLEKHGAIREIFGQHT